MHHKIKHVIWDWNGTLVNDAWLFVELMNEELNKRKLPLIDIEQYRQNFTFPVKQYYKNLGFNFQKEDFKEVGYNFIQKYKKRKNEPLLYKNTVEILNQLSLLGITQSIVSAQENNLLQESIQHYKIGKNFQDVQGIDHYYADSKIKIAENSLKKINYKKTQIMMIGDTAHDAEVAESLGIQCILFSNGHYTKKRLQQLNYTIINSHLQLVKYL